MYFYNICIIILNKLNHKKYNMATLSNTLFFLKDFSSMAFQISIKKGISGIRLLKQKAVHHEHVKKYIEPNINDIEYLLKIVIVIVDCLEIFCASQVFGGIYDNLKWKIVDHYFCIWLLLKTAYFIFFKWCQSYKTCLQRRQIITNMTTRK